MRRFATISVLAALPILSGCVAALLPLAAVGAIGKGEIDRAKAKREIVAAGAVDLAPARTASVAIVPEQPASIEQDDFDGQGGLLESTEILDQIVPDGEYYSPFTEFTNFALAQNRRFKSGDKVSSVVLIPSISLEKPKTISCSRKPLAVLIDLDNDEDKDWLEAETIYRQNGLVDALETLRNSKISVIWISSEPSKAAGKLASILHEAGFSGTDAEDFLFLDRGGEDRKQARRWDAAQNYCIVAMAGDKRSDFDELYDYLLKPNGAAPLDYMFDSGWFLTPPPLVSKPSIVDAPDSATPAEKTDQSEG